MHDHPHHDEHEDRNLERIDQPLDAANQSLADALKASFGILKIIMMVLVVFYLFSNVRRIDSHEEALTLRLGALRPHVHQAGLVWGLPIPIDEIVPLPTKKSNNVVIDSHMFHRRPEEMGKSLAFVMRGSHRGLDPALDGALLTADSALVHTLWKVTYKINDVSKFVSGILGDKVDAADGLIKSFVETAGVQLASEMTAEEIIRTRVADVQNEMRRRVNERLRRLDSGILVTLVEMDMPTPPITVREAFEKTQRAENNKQRRITEAEQAGTQVLHQVAGENFAVFLSVLDEFDAADPTTPAYHAIKDRLDRMLIEDLGGEAGKLVRQAEAYQTIEVGAIEADVRLYEELLTEFKRNPEVLVSRLYEEMRHKLMQNDRITKVYFPGKSEFRIHVGPDPEQARRAETRSLQSQGIDVSKLGRDMSLHPIGPELE